MVADIDNPSFRVFFRCVRTAGSFFPKCTMTKQRRKESKERRFRVYACSTDYVCIDIFARNAKHAYEIASDVDGGHFRVSDRNYDLGSWEIVDAQEVPPDEPFDPLDERHYASLGR